VTDDEEARTERLQEAVARMMVDAIKLAAVVHPDASPEMRLVLAKLILKKACAVLAVGEGN
jgi:hypothetical protein